MDVLQDRGRYMGGGGEHHWQDPNGPSLVENLPNVAKDSASPFSDYSFGWHQWAQHQCYDGGNDSN